MASLRAVLGVLSKAQEVVFGGELSDTEVTEANFFGKVFEVLTEHLVLEGALPAFPGSAQSRSVFTLGKEVEHGLVGREIRAPAFDVAE